MPVSAALPVVVSTNHGMASIDIRVPKQFTPDLGTRTVTDAEGEVQEELFPRQPAYFPEGLELPVEHRGVALAPTQQQRSQLAVGDGDGRALPDAIRSWLESHAVQALALQSDDEVMGVARRGRPRVALFDARTRAGDAATAMRRLKRDSFTGIVPTVAITGDDPAEIIEAFDAGAFAIEAVSRGGGSVALQEEGGKTVIRLVPLSAAIAASARIVRKHIPRHPRKST